MSVTTENELTYLVDGLSCEHCKVAVTDEVQRVHGVEYVSVDLETKRVVVRGRDVSDADVRTAVDEAGYDAVSA
jgi:copper chaperone CopZ